MKDCCAEGKCGTGECAGGGCGGGEREESEGGEVEGGGGCGGCAEKMHGPKELEYGDYKFKLFYNGQFLMEINEDGSLVKAGEDSGRAKKIMPCVDYLSVAERDYGVDPEAIVRLASYLEAQYEMIKEIKRAQLKYMEEKITEWQAMYKEIIFSTVRLRDEEGEVLDEGEFTALDKGTLSVEGDEASEEEVGEEGGGSDKSAYDESVELAQRAIEKALEKK